MQAKVKKLIGQMSEQMLRKDFFVLKRQLSQNAKKGGKAFEQVLQRIEQAYSRYRQRLEQKPQPTLVADLPISEQSSTIIEAIKKHQVVVIAGETGSGKTTQIGKLCLQAGLGDFGQIACTQPRRIAAKSVAVRVAEELKQPLGQAVGYQVRFDEKYSAEGWLRFMTDGMLLQQTLQDRWLNDYDVIIIDEAHERSLNIDFLLGFLKKLIAKRQDLKVIITSATIDTEKFSQHFNQAPIINVSGRCYPVHLHYRDLQEKNLELNQGIIRALDEIYGSSKDGDVLIFLPGEREINEALEQLKRKQLPNTEVLPLYARLTAEQQMRIFKPAEKRRVILSTNVAETSLTVPRIHYVIDSGLARISRYSARSKIQGLQIENIAQDSANQRSGRCGRIAEGHCFRLYSEQDFEARQEHTDAEILRTSLAAVILQSHVLRLGHLTEFPFIDAPDFKMIADGYQLLIELQALDEGQNLTKIGRIMAHLPIDVQLARVLIQANRLGALRELLIIVAALSIQDPRERPLEWSQAADKAHQKFADDESDFITLLNLWKTLNSKRKAYKNAAFKQWCKENFISIKRFMEWRDVHRQLGSLVKQQNMIVSEQAADYAQIHQALLAGFISHIGSHQSKQEYLGTRHKKFMIFPGSGLFNSNPRWIVSAQIVHTSQVFARTVAKIEPEWITEIGKHLLKVSVYDPYWSKKQGSVMGYQRSTLLGLVLQEKQTIHYGPHDVDQARQIFIEKALVEQQLNTRLDFYHHNNRLIAQIHAEEDRQRNKNLLIDQGKQYDLYDAVIAEGIYSEAQLRRWVKKHGERELKFYAEQLYQQQTAGLREELYPEQIKVRQLSLPAQYHFDPGSDDDGITVNLPLAWLNALNANDFEYLVPGLLVEKLETLIKGLPKSLRRGLIPAAHYAQIITERMNHDEPFYPQLVSLVKQINGLSTEPAEWQKVTLPNHLKIRFRVQDQQGKTITTTRDFKTLSGRLKDQANQSFQNDANQTKTINGATDWVFGEIAQKVILDNGLPAYSGLVEQQNAVGLRLFETPEQALKKHRQGVKKLLQLKYPKIFKQALNAFSDLKANHIWQVFETGNSLNHDLMMALVEQHLDQQPFINNRTAFDQTADYLKTTLYQQCHQWLTKITPILLQWYETWQLVEQQAEHLDESGYNDMIRQLDLLLYADCFRHLRYADLSHFPRFINGLKIRLEAALHNPAKEAEKSQTFSRVSQAYYQQLEQSETFGEQQQNLLMLLEEYRISIFAQQLGCKQKVSEKRLMQALTTSTC